MSPEIHLRITGLLLLLLVVLNLYVPRRFRWGEEIQRLSLFTRQVFVVHAGFIVLILAMMGFLCLVFAHDLLAPSRLARLMLIGLLLFWVARLAVQWLVYDARLWRGHRFNTVMHYLFTTMWCYFAATYGLALWVQLQA